MDFFKEIPVNYVTIQRCIATRMQVVVLSGFCSMDVAVERTWRCLQRPDKTTTRIFFHIMLNSYFIFILKLLANLTT